MDADPVALTFRAIRQVQRHLCQQARAGRYQAALDGAWRDVIDMQDRFEALMPTTRRGAWIKAGVAALEIGIDRGDDDDINADQVRLVKTFFRTPITLTPEWFVELKALTEDIAGKVGADNLGVHELRQIADGLKVAGRPDNKPTLH
jgi:hypothetical protein